MAVIPFRLSAISEDRLPSAAGGSSRATSFGNILGGEAAVKVVGAPNGTVGETGAVEGRLGRKSRVPNRAGSKPFGGVLLAEGMRGSGRRWNGNDDVGLMSELDDGWTL